MQKYNYIILSIGVLILLLIISACSSSQKETIFNKLSADQSGIHFGNDITEKDGQIDENLYMGGGVGIGDFNNDGLKDIYFTGNQVSSRLYINQGENKFKDITDSANVGTSDWASGVSIADINNDSFDDIYVCVYGGENLLFVNQHDLTFTEEAAVFGLNDSSYSTQAAFFDYNKDGKTDVFLVNYYLNGPNPNVLHSKNKSGNSPANDRLYQNRGYRDGHPYFQNVSKRAGIRGDGYGLGVAVSDYNRDSWPDLYVTNDFLSNDELWLNNHDGTFRNVIARAIRHQSYSSMGVDAADINNDFWPDIITLDMMPELNSRQKMQYTFMNYERYQQERSFSYEPEFMRNMLQLNNGNRSIDSLDVPFFSEIGQFAGISETEWSWSALAADFNNDQWKDIYITNGSGRDFLNADFIEYSISGEAGMRGNPKKSKELSQKLKELGYVKTPNYLFLNNQDYTFKNVQDSSGLSSPSISNGAAYVDTDNDGDLDLVVNNINEPASVFINSTIQKGKENTTNHFLKIDIAGPTNNRDAFGTKVHIYHEGKKQIQEHYPARGYASSVDQTMLFGLGSTQKVDSLKVIWPDQKAQILKNVPADTLLELQYKNAAQWNEINPTEFPKLFTDVTGQVQANYKHLDVPYNDFKSQPLLPQKFSQLGPPLATGDINNDKRTDFFIGGGFNSSGALFTKLPDHSFQHTLFDTTKKYQEDTAAQLFDADNDSDLDLLIAYGDTRYNRGSVYYKPRLYKNDERGNFRLDPNAIPDNVRTIAGSIATADYDGDGDEDLFIGGRISNMYPTAPRSYLLENQNGRFKDVTQQAAPELQNPGMITQAVWMNLDDDSRPDLVLAGEWMPLRFFKNDSTKLHEITNQTGLRNLQGVWRSLATCDIDQDGDTDLIAGNLGQNNKYHVTTGKPLKLYAADIDENGFIDPVMFYHIKDKSGKQKLYPAYNRDKLLRQVRALQQVFPTNEDYSNVTFNDIFDTVDDENIMELTVNETKSSVFENTGNGQFKQHPLPAEAQFAPVNAIICSDLNNDGNVDLLVAGNEYQVEPRTGRYDASYGLFLKGNGKLKFTPVGPAESGFIINGDVKDMALISNDDTKYILVGVNDDSLRVFEAK